MTIDKILRRNRIFSVHAGSGNLHIFELGRLTGHNIHLRRIYCSVGVITGGSRSREGKQIESLPNEARSPQPQTKITLSFGSSFSLVFVCQLVRTK